MSVDYVEKTQGTDAAVQALLQIAYTMLSAICCGVVSYLFCFLRHVQKRNAYYNKKKKTNNQQQQVHYDVFYDAHERLYYDALNGINDTPRRLAPSAPDMMRHFNQRMKEDPGYHSMAWKLICRRNVIKWWALYGKKANPPRTASLKKKKLSWSSTLVTIRIEDQRERESLWNHFDSEKANWRGNIMGNRRANEKDFWRAVSEFGGDSCKVSSLDDSERAALRVEVEQFIIAFQQQPAVLPQQQQQPPQQLLICPAAPEKAPRPEDVSFTKTTVPSTAAATTNNTTEDMEIDDADTWEYSCKEIPAGPVKKVVCPGAPEKKQQQVVEKSSMAPRRLEEDRLVVSKAQTKVIFKATTEVEKIMVCPGAPQKKQQQVVAKSSMAPRRLEEDRLVVYKHKLQTKVVFKATTEVEKIMVCPPAPTKKQVVQKACPIKPRRLEEDRLVVYKNKALEPAHKSSTLVIAFHFKIPKQLPTWAATTTTTALVPYNPPLQQEAQPRQSTPSFALKEPKPQPPPLRRSLRLANINKKKTAAPPPKRK